MLKDIFELGWVHISSGAAGTEYGFMSIHEEQFMLRVIVQRKQNVSYLGSDIDIEESTLKVEEP